MSKSAGETEPDDAAETLRVLVIGDTGVGKTSLVLRFANNTFNEHYVSTVNFEFKQCSLDLDGCTVRMHIWDTAGQERFRTITAAQFQEAHGIMVVFDSTSEDSFAETRHWLREVERYATEKVFIMLVGSKCDLAGAKQREPDQAMHKHVTERIINTSAKTGQGVRDAFVAMATGIQKHLRDSTVVHRMRNHKIRHEHRAGGASKGDQAQRGAGMLHRGWAMKRRPVFPAIWQARWFVLTQAELNYSKTAAQDAAVVGRIQLSDITHLSRPPTLDKRYLDIHTQPRIYHLAFKTELECTTWYITLLTTLRLMPFEEVTFSQGPPVPAPDAATTPYQHVLAASVPAGLVSTGVGASISSAHGRRAATPSAPSLSSHRRENVVVRCPRLASLAESAASIDREIALFQRQRIASKRIIDVLAHGRMDLASLAEVERQQRRRRRRQREGRNGEQAQGGGRDGQQDKEHEADVDKLVSRLAASFQHVPFILTAPMDLTLEACLFDSACPLAVAEALYVAFCLADAVAYLHTHDPLIVHGDIAPSNVLLNAGFEVKLAGFSSAHVCQTHGQTFDDSVGVPGYTAPEVLAGKPWTRAVDSYSVGVVLFELVFQRRAYLHAGQSFQEYMHAVTAYAPPVPAPASATELAELDAQHDTTLGTLITSCLGPEEQRPAATHILATVSGVRTKFASSEQPAPPSWMAPKLHRMQRQQQTTGGGGGGGNDGDNGMGGSAAGDDTCSDDSCAGEAPCDYDAVLCFRTSCDGEAADLLVPVLEQAGLRVATLDTDAEEEGADPTAQWSKMEGVLRRSRVVVPLLSDPALLEAGPCKGIHNVTPHSPVDGLLLACELAVSMSRQGQLSLLPVGLSTAHREAAEKVSDDRPEQEREQEQEMVVSVAAPAFAALDPAAKWPSTQSPTCNASIQETMAALFDAHVHRVNQRDAGSRRVLVRRIACAAAHR